MPFYFAFQNRRVKSKVKRSLTFGSKTRKKARKSSGFSSEGLTYNWSDSAANELDDYGNSASSYPRRHSLEGSVLNRTHGTSPVQRRVFTPPLKRSEKGPPKPPRMMEKKLFTCEYPNCQKSEELLGMVAINFKACPACFTHYCSTKCRVAHWTTHKLVCHYGRIKSYMKTIADICQNDEDVRGLLSSLASSGYCVKGRGCVMLIFASPNAARLFIEERIGKRPTYSSLNQVETLGVKTNHKKNLLKLITSYKPKYELVLNVAIVAERNLPPSPVPRNKEPSVIEQFIVSLRDKAEGSTSETCRKLSL